MFAAWVFVDEVAVFVGFEEEDGGEDAEEVRNSCHFRYTAKYTPRRPPRPNITHRKDENSRGHYFTTQLIVDKSIIILPILINHTLHGRAGKTIGVLGDAVGRVR